MKILKLLKHRVTLVVILLVLQLVLVFGSVWYFKDDFIYFYTIYLVISVFTVLQIINNRSNPAYKIAWLIPVTLLPIFGTIIYLIFGNLRIRQSYLRKMQGILVKEQAAIAETLPQVKLPETELDATFQSTYLTNYGNSPLSTNTTSNYLPLGDLAFAEMKKQLEKAENYIFMEYFIIQPGKMWDEILAILIRKVQAGVDVRLIYDDFGCLFTLPDQYDQELEKLGIKCSIFNPFVPVLSSIFNNRNHRKLLIIDGKVAFTGGINLADEYINVKERFDHWKDDSIMLKGDGAWSFTLMFLTLWDFQRNEEHPYSSYFPGRTEQAQSVGFYQPYTDMPFDNEAVGENLYLSLIGRAKQSIYITTPYLIIDNLLMEALCSAAKGGIDVRIQTPHIPDKWYAHALTRSNYEQLIEAGVRIFEYTPGFIHSKTFVVDELYATVGTVNLDYRSLYLHIECGVWMYQTTSVSQVAQTFAETELLCQEITLEMARDVNWFTHLGRAILNVFAPLM